MQNTTTAAPPIPAAGTRHAAYCKHWEGPCKSCAVDPSLWNQGKLQRQILLLICAHLSEARVGFHPLPHGAKEQRTKARNVVSHWIETSWRRGSESNRGNFTVSSLARSVSRLNAALFSAGPSRFFNNSLTARQCLFTALPIHHLVKLQVKN